MVKRPKEWKHKLVVAQAQRAKDVAEVAELVRQGYTYREIGARKGRSYQWAFNRYHDALAQWREDSNGEIKKRIAESEMRLLLIFREAYAGWERSKVEQERTRTKRRTAAGDKGEGDKGGDGWEEAEIERKKRDGDPRHLDVALRAHAQLMRLWGLDKQQHEFTGPANLFQVLLKLQPQATVWIDEDGQEVAEGGAEVKALPAPSDSTE